MICPAVDAEHGLSRSQNASAAADSQDHLGPIGAATAARISAMSFKA